MSTALPPNDANLFGIHFGPVLKNVSAEDFFGFCRLNREWRIERTSNGDVIFTAPTGGETGGRCGKGA